jgi:hypothetical protein
MKRYSRRASADLPDATVTRNGFWSGVFALYVRAAPGVPYHTGHSRASGWGRFFLAIEDIFSDHAPAMDAANG